ncbi:hypothetical protein K435DRAFT_857221 [Dendrothele bispora CBS 962.96]|uniref:F-box domain-containing protein n=1 Tax=Dendrothele bispora (strain CBS 962.96) TaxID=1314807 RepID=A0A4S8M6H1_DENBC|nr:hypothetical protein K435DRAFT_857221 [Dendrothele bispora CBS 962.96]
MLLHLPPELITYILTFAQVNDILNLQKICKFLRDFVSGSVLLQYRILLHASGMLDNPRSPYSLKTRYQMLKHRERSWLLLEPSFSTCIPAHHSSVVIYELSGGAYLLSELPRRTVNFITLPSSPNDPVPKWRSHYMEENTRLLDFGIAVQEHDLLALVTTQVVIPFVHTPDDPNTTLQIRWVQLSTGEPHPLSGPPMTFVEDAPFECIGIGMEIVGDLTCLVLHDARPDFLDRDRVLLIDWKKSIIRAQLSSPSRRYYNATFLSPDVLLIPNALEASLEIWRIPPPSSSNSQLELTTPNLHFLLPSRDNFFEVTNFVCRSAPTHSSNPSPNDTRPFRSDPNEAIILFHLTVSPLYLGVPQPLMFFAHRKSFLELLNAYGDPSSPCPPVPWSSWGPSRTRFLPQTRSEHEHWITTTSGQRFVFLCSNHPYNGLEQPIMIYDFNQALVRRVIAAENARKASVFSQVQTRRKLDSHSESDTSGDQHSGPESNLLHIPLLDSVDYDNFRLGWDRPTPPVQSPQQSTQTSQQPWQQYDYPLLMKIFTEPVGGYLPYVISASSSLALRSSQSFPSSPYMTTFPNPSETLPISSSRYSFDGILMDDERIIGVRAGRSPNPVAVMMDAEVEDDSVDSIEVFWFG